MVKIRLQRLGAKKAPFYRIVAADSRCPRDGRFLEIVGNYNPLKRQNNFHFKKERIEHWLKKGAQPTDRVRALLNQQGFAFVRKG